MTIMTTNPETFLFKRASQIVVAFLLLVTLSVFSNVSPIKAEDLTFSWRSNPVEELIFSYRLYYGPESRYETVGISFLKNDFLYEYFIDFVLELRCPVDNSNSIEGCEQLPPGTVSCKNSFWPRYPGDPGYPEGPEYLGGPVYSEYQQCTVLDLPSQSYFTLTAYDGYEAESYYSAEITNYVPDES